MQIPSFLTLLVLTGATLVQAQDPRPEWLTGQDFQQRLEDPGLVSLSGLPLRDVLAQIEKSYGLACLRDRRIDPDQIVELPESQGTVLHLIKTVAASSEAAVSLPGNVVYLGPQSRSRLLRTLILQRTADVRRIDKTRADSEWLKPRTFAWPLLSEPRDLATTLAESVGVTIANPELIEHDLWAADALPEMTPVEILSVLLVGFDLTYVLSEDGASITLVSLPEAKDLAVSKSYTLSREEAMNKEETISNWLQVAPSISLNESGRRVLVKGMVEDHVAIRDLRSGKLKPDGDDANVLEPLDRRLFTLRAEGLPASTMIQELEKNGIRIVYDRRALRQHGIDLEQHVKIDVNNVSADVFFATLFGPLGLECELSGITVRLKPK